jgi:hypothetical protein
MENLKSKEEPKSFTFRKMTSKDYGKTAIICLLLAGFKGAYFESAGLFLDLLVDILAIFGAISGFFWIKEKIKSKNKRF